MAPTLTELRSAPEDGLELRSTEPFARALRSGWICGRDAGLDGWS